MPEKLARFRVNDKPVNGAMSPQQQQDIPRVMEIGKKYRLEILPPSGA